MTRVIFAMRKGIIEGRNAGCVLTVRHQDDLLPVAAPLNWSRHVFNKASKIAVPPAALSLRMFWTRAPSQLSNSGGVLSNRRRRGTDHPIADDRRQSRRGSSTDGNRS